MIRAYAAVDPAGGDAAWAEAYVPFGAGEITITRPEDVKGKGKKPDAPEVSAAKDEAIARRKEVDEKILANLLRLNLARAATQ